MLRLLILVTLTAVTLSLPGPFTLCIGLAAAFCVLLWGYRSPDRPAPEIQAELDYRRRGWR